jgi:hypothetical protein
MLDKPRLTLLAIIMMLLISQTSLASCKVLITQDRPVLKSIDLGDAGKSQGDLLFGEAAIRYDRKIVGKVGLMLTTIELPDPTLTGREANEDRFGSLVFRFSEIDTLIVSGTTLLPPEQKLIAINTPQARAIIGGTGRFKFSRGQVMTTRFSDGTYEHEFELDGPGRLCRFK